MNKDEEQPNPPAPDSDGKETQDGAENDPLRQSDVAFAFGPDSSYFLRSNNITIFSIANKAMQAINAMDYSQLFTAAITPEEGFMAAFKANNGSPVWMWAKGEDQNFLSSNAAQPLKTRQEIFETLATHTDLPSLQQSSLTFGPGGSFFARIKYTTYSSFLPTSLKSQIDSKKRAAEETKSTRVFPLQVALGVGGAWVALWSDKSYSWNLGNQYDQLHQILNAITENNDKPEFVALCPYKTDDYFFVARNGLITYSVSNLGEKASAYLDNATNGYLQLRARKDGIVYQHKRTVKNAMKSYVIGPETKFPTELSEITRINNFGGTSQILPMNTIFNPNGAGIWRRIELANIRRRDLIPIATAGLCTATACNYAGLPKIMTVSATVGAIAGTSACCWFLNIFSDEEQS